MDSYLYYCPNCNKLFKVDCRGKKLKCSRCSETLLDLDTTSEDYSKLTDEAKASLKNRASHDEFQQENPSYDKIVRIIHCSDVHLDSKMTSNLDISKAKERKGEILNTFLDMIDYAADNRVEAIIIAGDLFDTKKVTANTRNSVINAIKDNSAISFFYLKGNHGGGDSFLESMHEKPENLFLFDDKWKSYSIYERNGKKLTISGIELCNENRLTVYSSLKLNPNNFNIVTMHGQISTYSNKGDAETISINELRGKNIDYLALGHVHEFQNGSIPPRGQYCYCGCLEGRGFDECGKHGFILMEINMEHLKCKYKIIDKSKRKHYDIKVDITGCYTNADIRARIDDAITNEGCKSKDLVKVVLAGSVDIECEKNAEYLSKQLLEKFYFAKVKDETKVAINYGDYMYDASLKGEFVRLVQEDQSLNDGEKAEIIRCGIRALNGEEIEI